jgi:hypothetical protein
LPAWVVTLASLGQGLGGYTCQLGSRLGWLHLPALVKAWVVAFASLGQGLGGYTCKLKVPVLHAAVWRRGTWSSEWVVTGFWVLTLASLGG